MQLLTIMLNIFRSKFVELSPNVPEKKIAKIFLGTNEVILRNLVREFRLIFENRYESFCLKIFLWTRRLQFFQSCRNVSAEIPIILWSISEKKYEVPLLFPKFLLDT